MPMNEPNFVVASESRERDTVSWEIEATAAVENYWLGAQPPQFVVQPPFFRHHCDSTPARRVQPANKIDTSRFRATGPARTYQVHHRSWARHRQCVSCSMLYKAAGAEVRASLRPRTNPRPTGNRLLSAKAFTAALLRPTVIARLIQKNG